MPFKMQGTSAPYQARLTVGGGFPYAWDLYKYTPKTGGGWDRVHVGGGKGQSWMEVSGLQAKDVLVWSVNVVNFDTEPLQVQVLTDLKDAGGQSQSEAGSWKATREAPQFFATVEVA